MKRNVIIGAILIVFGLAALTAEINFIMNYFEKFYRKPEAIAGIKSPVVHAPPVAVIESPKSQTWEDMVSYIQSRNKKVYPKLAQEISDYVIEYSEKYNINPHIVISMIDVESEYNYASVSKKNAVGLMQIVYNCWKDDPDFKRIVSEEKDLFDPKLNIEAGCLILKKLKKKHKNIRGYLNAYYGGTGYFEKVYVAFGRYQLSTDYD